jgi:toxin ParE1/3/4
MLAEHSLIGEARDELVRGLRCFSVGNYVIYYRLLVPNEQTVEIVRVLHGARDVERISW